MTYTARADTRPKIRLHRVHTSPRDRDRTLHMQGVSEACLVIEV